MFKRKFGIYNFSKKQLEVIEKQPKVLSDRINTALQNKVDDHNDKHGDNPTKRATLRMLQAVFRRGIGAYQNNPASVRPRVANQDQWAYARVNSYLFALRSGRFQGGQLMTILLQKLLINLISMLFLLETQHQMSLQVMKQRFQLL